MSRKRLFLYVLLGIAIAVTLYIFFTLPAHDHSAMLLSDNPENAMYMIGSNPIALVNGTAEHAIIPSSAAKIKTAIFGRPVYGDISGDGKDDAVMFLSQDTGGSGIFYYAVAAVKIGGQYAGLNAVFLGDRIAPQNINVFKGVANVNYAARSDRQPFTTPPSIGTTKYLIVKDGQLIEIPQPQS
jgi:hypothetical protein